MVTSALTVTRMTRSPDRPMPTFRQITIIGTGLIGGSFALAAKAKGFRGRIVGCDRKPVLTKAKRIGAIDVAIADPIAACQNSDLVLLATPVGGIVELIEKLGPHLSPETLLTDVGSTKSTIICAAQESFGSHVAHRFLGGHPMAGKENSGIEFADAELFQGAVWFLTPTGEQRPKTGGKIAEFSRLIRGLGAKIISLDAAEHDRLCAWISHVPQMISTALAAVLVEEYSENAPLLEAGGRALREMTRIASSPYSMWRDIAITNKQQISDALLKLEQELAHIRENLDTRMLEEEFECAHRLKGRSPGKRQIPSRR
jgi:prephenate dehydrogenase